MHSLPTDPHDLVLLLIQSVTDQQPLDRGGVGGKLPVQFDFRAVDTALAGFHIAGFCDAADRRIEFYPTQANVYRSLSDLLAYPSNLIKVPSRFTILDLAYTHGNDAECPPSVMQYLSVVRLCSLLTKSADHNSNGGTALYFIKSHDAKVELRLQYQAGALLPLPALDAFAADFVDSTHHQDQKRNIVRNALLETFKGSRTITVDDLLPKFDALIESIRNAYSMYVAEFSFEKVRAQVEKDNLDSTLKLNKTLSDIQNQLLAVPVAMILVGGQMSPESGLAVKNLVIWIGSLIFAWIMGLLITNQSNAIEAIDEEVRLRKATINAQPDDIAGKFKKGFSGLEKRVCEQTKTLGILEVGIAISIVFSTLLLIWFSRPEIRVYFG